MAHEDPLRNLHYAMLMVHHLYDLYNIHVGPCRTIVLPGHHVIPQIQIQYEAVKGINLGEAQQAKHGMRRLPTTSLKRQIESIAELI